MASKAQAWAESASKPPRFELGARIAASVEITTGELNITAVEGLVDTSKMLVLPIVLRVDPRRAVPFAKWLIDTFGEAPSA